MADYDNFLRLAEQDYGENPDAWGGFLNENFKRIGEAFSIIEVTVDADVVLTTENILPDQSRRMGLKFVGAGGFDVTHAAIPKLYFVVNDCAAAITILPESGAGVSVRPGFQGWYYTNADASQGFLADLTLDKIAKPTASVDLNSQKLVNMAKAEAATDGATLSNEIHEFAALTEPLSVNGQRIAHLGAPQEAADAVPRSYVDAVAGSASAAAASAAAAAATLAAINSKFTISTQPPSGGNDGDVWFRIA